MRYLLKALVAMCAMSIWSGVSAGVIASFDFEDGNTTGWSTSSITTAPIGEKHLGEFSSAAISYALAGLDSYDTLSVTFDFYVIRTWGGDGREVGFPPYGPDSFSFTLNGEILLDETFCSPSPNCGPGQEYEPSYTEPPYAENTLGYTYTRDGVTRLMDRTYRFTFDTTTFDNSLELFFTGTMNQWNDGNLSDQSWGLDNVVVETSVTTEASEPTTTALLALGLLGLGIAARRRRVK